MSCQPLAKAAVKLHINQNCRSEWRAKYCLGLGECQVDIRDTAAWLNTGLLTAIKESVDTGHQTLAAIYGPSFKRMRPIDQLDRQPARAA